MVHTALLDHDFCTEHRLTGAYLLIALLALFVGVATGAFTSPLYAGINLYAPFAPVLASYYHGLSLHGVMNALVWTTFFICRLFTFYRDARPSETPGEPWPRLGHVLAHDGRAAAGRRPVAAQ